MSIFSCTGYTDQIQNGKITNGRDFLELCLRNFNVMLKYRDEPLGIIKPTFERDEKEESYAERRLKEITEELSHFKETTLSDLMLEEIDNREKEIVRLKKILNDAIIFNNELDKIYSEVESWNSEDEFINIKEFAKSQIIETKEHLDIDFYKNRITELEDIIQKIKDPDTGQEYTQKMIDSSINHLEYLIGVYKDDIIEEKERDKNKNSEAFYNHFIESINKINIQ